MIPTTHPSQSLANELRTAAAVNFESQASYSVRVRTTDSSGLTFEQVLPITVTDVNEAPSQLQLSTSTVVDGTTAGSILATISATEPDAGDALVYSLAVGTATDNAEVITFTVSGIQLLLVNNVSLASKPSYNIRLRATDNAGLSTEAALVKRLPSHQSRHGG